MTGYETAHFPEMSVTLIFAPSATNRILCFDTVPPNALKTLARKINRRYPIA